MDDDDTPTGIIYSPTPLQICNGTKVKFLQVRVKVRPTQHLIAAENVPKFATLSPHVIISTEKVKF